MTKNEAASVAQLTDALSVAAFIERKADDYARQFGTNDMGSLSFGNEDMRIYHWHLVELADEIRALAEPAAPATGESGDGRHFSGGNQELPSETMARIRATPPAAKSEASRIERLKDAIEGECEGLGITDGNARAILAYVDDKSLLEKLWSEARGHMPDGMCGFTQAANFAALLAAKSEAAASAELVSVLRAVDEQFRRFGNNLPDGFDTRVFGWVRDALAASQPGEMGAGVPVELALCEQEHIILKPNQLYRFTVLSGCAQCEALARGGMEVGESLPIGSLSPAASAQQDEREAGYMPLTGAMRLVREKLARFEECAGDDEGCDIGREWFDALTTIGLLARTQRSPAMWSMTPAGEALLAQQVQADAGAVADQIADLIWNWAGLDGDCEKRNCIKRIRDLLAHPSPAAENDKRDATEDVVALSIIRCATAVVKHWNEFGPEYDFERAMHRLDAAIEARAAMSREQSGGDRG